jgi:uncharacterized membrane protein YfcA
MTVLVFTLLVGLGAVGAGLIGALTGLGGGVILLPMLTLLFGVDVHYAVGATLVSVIATSSGSAAAYVKEGYSNVRVGMFLEVATTLGAVTGAYLVIWHVVPTGAIAIIFGVVILASAYLSSRHRPEGVPDTAPDPLATRLRMDSTYPTPAGLKPYHVHNVPLGWLVMFIAGVLSGLLGIGSGALKVLAMDQIMRLPFKVSTTTSNFMIGVTAAASAGLYLHEGYIDPGLAMPVMLGVLIGAMLGARLLVLANVSLLRIVFSVVIVVLAVQMIYHGIAGDLK